MFWSKNKRKIDIPLQTPDFIIKVGFKGVYFSRTCFPDVITEVSIAGENNHYENLPMQ